MSRDGQRGYKRIGDAAKCPACGWRMDPQAYRCPKCFIYFCFKCRARVTEREPQYQCADQSCQCYGKLLCAACTVMVPEHRDVTRDVFDEVPDEPEKMVKGGVTIIGWMTIGLFFAAWQLGWAMYSFGVGAIFAVIAVVASAALCLYSGDPFFYWYRRTKILPATTKRVPRQVTENKQIGLHRCCIQCRRPAKELR